MYIKKCPKCGRLPKIKECVSFDDTKRYLIRCPNYCSVLKSNKNEYDITWELIIHDNVDDNTIYKIWNEALIDG